MKKMRKRRQLIKRAKKWLLAFMVVVCVVGIGSDLFLSYGNGVVAKEEETNQENAKDEDDKTSKPSESKSMQGSFSCDDFDNEEDVLQCKADRKAGTTAPKFVIDAITNDYEKEKNEDYVLYIMNTTQTALAYNLSIWDLETFIMHGVNIIITIFEVLFFAVSFVIMCAYNLASGDFLYTSLNTTLNNLNETLLDTSDVNSMFMKILMILVSIALVKKVFESLRTARGSMLTPLRAIVSTFFSVILIVVIARNGNNIVLNIESTISSSIIETFSDSETDLDIENKNLIFDLFQKQAFILRHFGVTDPSQISNINSGDYSEYMKDVEIPATGEERVFVLLSNPSQENAEVERKMYGSTSIPYSAGSVGIALFFSIVMGIHRVLLFVVIGSLVLLYLGIGIAKQIMIFVSIWALMLMVFEEDKKRALNWFISRLCWVVAFAVLKIVFNTVLTAICELVKSVGSINAMFLIILDIILVFLIKFVWSNKERIMNSIKGLVGVSSNSGMFDVASAVITGDFSIGDAVDNFRYGNSKNRNWEDDDSTNESGVPTDDNESAAVNDESMSDPSELNEIDDSNNDSDDLSSDEEFADDDDKTSTDELQNDDNGFRDDEDINEDEYIKDVDGNLVKKGFEDDDDYANDDDDGWEDDDDYTNEEQSDFEEFNELDEHSSNSEDITIDDLRTDDFEDDGLSVPSFGENESENEHDNENDIEHNQSSTSTKDEKPTINNNNLEENEVELRGNDDEEND